MSRKVSDLLRSASDTQAALRELADELDIVCEKERKLRILGNIGCLIGAGNLFNRLLHRICLSSVKSKKSVII